MEAGEASGWAEKLRPEEVELACRYAAYELNGFPPWFAALFAAHPAIVNRFLLKEIRYELSIEKVDSDSHYILYAVSSAGQWAWSELAPGLYAILKKREPKNLANLGYLLKILQGSSMTDGDLAKLASKKCNTLGKIDHVSHWFAVWVGVAPVTAISALRPG